MFPVGVQSSKLLQSLLQKWEYVKLANLLTYDTQSRGDTLTITQDGQSMVVRQQDESLGCKKINDIATWLRAFSIYVVSLAVSETSNSEQFKSLMVSWSAMTKHNVNCVS